MTREDGDALAPELAKLAGLDVAAMLAGRMAADDEWTRFVAALATLNERHPDKTDAIAALVERIDLAADRGDGRGGETVTPIIATAPPVKVAVLFARADSHYKALPGCDVWDIERDARNWLGGCPVVAHPPCRAWGSLRRFAKPEKGERRLAVFALRQVRRWGGVLEHPAKSRLWPRCRLPKPGAGPDRHGGWTLGITQHWWGHRATKATLLYVCGVAPRDIPDWPPLRLGEGTHAVKRDSRGYRPQSRQRPHITIAERELTPPALARWLVDLAARCKARPAQDGGPR